MKIVKPIWKIPFSLKQLQERCAHTIIDYLGIHFVEIGDDFLKAELAFAQHLTQPMGLMHGGVSCVLAETVGSAAGNCCVDFSTHYCLGLDINTNHIYPVKGGILSATARPYHLGKLSQVWSIEIYNQEHLISISRLTLVVMKRFKETI